VDNAEHIEWGLDVKGEVVATVAGLYRKPLETPEDDQRCAVLVIRQAILDRRNELRLKFFETLDKHVLFLFRKIWQFKTIEEASKAGFFYSFGDGGEEGKWDRGTKEYNGDGMHWLTMAKPLPLASTREIQDYYDAGTGVSTSGEGEQHKDCNTMRFITMCTETDRFIVSLHYVRTLESSDCEDEAAHSGANNKNSITGSTGIQTSDSVLSAVSKVHDQQQGKTAAEMEKLDESVHRALNISRATLEKILVTHPNFMVKDLPVEPEDMEEHLVRRVDLHVVAVNLLAAYSRMTVNETLGSTMISLRAVRALAITLSGVIRHGLGLPLTKAEEAAKGKLTAKKKTKADGEFSVFRKRKRMKPAEEAAFFKIEKEDWVLQYIHQKFPLTPAKKSKKRAGSPIQTPDAKLPKSVKGFW